jgi:Arc/MetJ family transcription regulator
MQYHISMKTTLDVDQTLVEKARKILGTRTLKDTVDQSLRAVIRQRALERLADAAGTLDLDLTVKSLRKQRRQRTPSVSG